MCTEDINKNVSSTETKYLVESILLTYIRIVDTYFIRTRSMVRVLCPG